MNGTDIAQIVLVIGGPVVAWLVLRWVFRRLSLRSYKGKMPELDVASVLFTSKWDIGVSGDRANLYLMRRSENRTIRVTSVLGYRRKEEPRVEPGVAGRSREVWSSDVNLEFRGDQGTEDESLSNGALSEVDKICRYLDTVGIRNLAVQAEPG